LPSLEVLAYLPNRPSDRRMGNEPLISVTNCRKKIQREPEIHPAS
jgi:hypothetical protein